MNSGILHGVLAEARPYSTNYRVDAVYAECDYTWRETDIFWKSTPGYVASAHAIGVHDTLAVHVVYGTKPATATTRFANRAFPSIRYINVYQWCLNSGGKSVPLSVYSHTGEVRTRAPCALGLCCNRASLHAMMWLHANEITKVDAHNCDYIYNDDPDVLLWNFEQGIIETYSTDVIVDVAIKYNNIESVHHLVSVYCIPFRTNGARGLLYASRMTILVKLPTRDLLEYFRNVVAAHTFFV